MECSLRRWQNLRLPSAESTVLLTSLSATVSIQGSTQFGVLTQYQPLRLNTHIGIGMPWDLDRNNGGVTILSPYERSAGSDWYSGTANAIYQNIDYIDTYNPDYVLILSGDHIYKMDYEVMLEYHKENDAAVTIACMPVPWEEAGRFGVVITDENGQIREFEEKPANPTKQSCVHGYLYLYLEGAERISDQDAECAEL